MTRRNNPELNDEREPIDKIKASIDLKKKTIRRNKRKRRLIKSIQILVVIGALLGIYYFDKSDASRIHNVRVNGNVILSDDEIKDALNIHENQRIYLTFRLFINQKGKKVKGIDNVDANVYYRQGIVNLNVTEKKAVGYTLEPTIRIYFEDGYYKEFESIDPATVERLPLLVGFTEESMTESLLAALATIDDGSMASVSEIHFEPTKVEPDYMRIVMNNDYFVFTNVETLPQLNKYATIISGADPNARCIEFIEYGPTEETQSAVVKACGS
ncbi:cell division protein DivIB [Erysipelothrix piscisicarius]|uniref:Cell division protein DivIB n=1 Tax=Erysipelothrix piscisicarius TaxID=2485784 RepID=A0A3Q8S7P8_9FIRM|nr:cell division protein DivIB [Erysipelothrix piscisicarius]AZK44293.1 cell division protein DivIB [Erysipelothrix piscisicarius]